MFATLAAAAIVSSAAMTSAPALHLCGSTTSQFSVGIVILPRGASAQATTVRPATAPQMRAVAGPRGGQTANLGGSTIRLSYE